MRVSFRAAVPADVLDILPRLRARDYAEIAAYGEPEEVIDRGLATSVAAWAAELDSEVALLWGLRSTNMLDDRAYLWMLGTDAVERHAVTFARYSRAAITMMLQRYSLLYGEVSSDYEASVRWLRWLGAQIHDCNTRKNGGVRTLIWQLAA
jgi:hypothetical protein